MLKPNKATFSKQLRKSAPAIFRRSINDVRKKIKRRKPSSQAIIQVADLAIPKLRDAIVRTVQAVKAAIDLTELENQISHQSMNGVLHVLDFDTRFTAAAKGAGIHPSQETLVGVIQNTFQEGAKIGILQLNKIDIQKAKKPPKVPKVGASMSFDMLNPKAVEHLQSYTFDLVTGLTKQSKLAIQDALINAFEEGGSPHDVAREIVSEIGLTQPQVLAVKNFKSMLKSGNTTQMRQALTRELRDARHDSTVLNAIANQKPLAKDAITKMVDKYADRSLKYRAETIARTETIRASAVGQRSAWAEAQAQGFLSKETKRQWLPNDDDKLCDICEGIPDLNEGGVDLDEPYSSDIGEIDGPPAHPSCRCAEGLVSV